MAVGFRFPPCFSWLSFLLLLTGVRLAATAEEPVEGGSGPVDAVIVVDTSGSMLLTDPQNLRYQGARLFLQFLGKDDQLGVVSFSRTASVLHPLEPFKPEFAQRVSASIEQAGATGEYTDVLAGITAARELLNTSGRPAARRIIVVLSDGKMEPDPSVRTAATAIQDLTERVLPELRAGETQVYTLAFSEQADQALLAEISSATDGLNWFTPRADKIHESFASLFLVVKKPQVLPLTSKGFRIDDEVDEATFYINREGAEGEISIVSPDGEEFGPGKLSEKMRWYSGQKFEVVTIETPASGDWQVRGVTSTDGFATVITDLKLSTSWPASIRVGERQLVEAQLFDAMKPIALPEMSGTVKFAFQITPTDKVSAPVIRDQLFDDGTNGDRIAGDGVLSHSVTLNEPGEYVLVVVAKGPTFQRNQQMPFRVKPRLLTVTVEPPGGDHHKEASEGEGGEDSEHGSGHGHGKHDDQLKVATADDFMVVMVSPEAMSLKELKVHASARDSKQRKFQLPLKRDLRAGERYTFPLALFPEDGDYEVQAGLSGIDRRRGEIGAKAEVLTIRRVKKDGVKPQAEGVLVQVEEEKKPVDTGPGFPWIGILGVTILNGALFFIGSRMVSKLGSTSTVPLSKYSPTNELMSLLEFLEARVSESEIDPSDPLYIAAQEGDMAAAPVDAAKNVLSASPTSAERDGAEAESSPESSNETQGEAE
jgi:von Willebrand factor type A domain